MAVFFAVMLAVTLLGTLFGLALALDLGGFASNRARHGARMAEKTKITHYTSPTSLADARALGWRYALFGVAMSALFVIALVATI